MINYTELFDRQEAIIRAQSSIIDDLFMSLMQHISAEEAGILPVIDKINAVAKLRQSIGGDNRC